MKMSNVKCQMSNVKRFFCLVLLLLTLPFTLYATFPQEWQALLIPSAHAQMEVSDTYDVADAEAVDGDIVSYTDKGVVRSTQEADPKIFGIIQDNAVISVKRVDESGKVVVRFGTANVNVSTIHGPIKIGDFITSSTMAGKGEKAEASGYVVGIAMQDFNEGEGEQATYSAPNTPSRQVSVGQIQIAVGIQYAELSGARNANRLFDAFNSAFFRNVQDPERFVNIFRYIAAGIAVLVSLAIGFFTFAKTIPKGIEALGRNPLARTTIQFGIIINIAFTVGIALIGVVAAIILLRF